MAIRMRTKWHTRGPKSAEDRAGVVGFNIWKIANESWKHMEQGGFRPGEDRQIVALMTEMMAFLMHVSDRLVYGQLPEDERARFMNALGQHLAKTLQTNMLDMFGPGDYTGPFVAILNQRLSDYSEFEFGEYTASYAMLRYLGDKMAEAMTGTDSKWVIEQIIDIEAPEALERIKKLVHEAMGVKIS